MRLFLIRHGETEHNKNSLALGRADVPLNEQGRWEIQRVAQALRNEPIAAVYSSPLQRALDTAKAIAEQHGLSVQVEPGLVEMDLGEADGLTYPEVRSLFPGLMEVWGSAEGPSHPMPGGERLMDVQARAWQTLGGLRARHVGETVAVVSHNFVILSILVRALGLELAQFRRLRQGTASFSLLDLQDDHATVLRINDACHLETAGD